MGTSTMGSDLHSDKQDKLLKLQARKKELEQLLAAKNEELYKLCVQEVQLTGIMPPEAPLSPEVPQRERLGSIRSADRNTDGDDVRDSSDASRRLRTVPSDSHHDSDQNNRKNHTHRLSTPSISGMSTKSSQSRLVRRPETSCSNFFPSPPQERSDTFSMHTSHTYPALANRHNAIENTQNDPSVSHGHKHSPNEYMNKIYYNMPEPHNVTRLRDTHFSSSHPDIPTHYTRSNHAPYQISNQNSIRNAPLVYQYASHLKAQNQHLAALPHHHPMQLPPKRRQESGRRNTLQRTQTYHITSHSDYNQHLENLADNYRNQAPMFQHRSQPDIQEQITEKTNMVQSEKLINVPNTLPLRERNTVRHPLHMQLQVSTDDYMQDQKKYPDAMSPVSQMSGYTQSNFDSVSMNRFSPVSQDMKVKEKQWYETSLDSPTKSEAPSVKRNVNLKRTSSVGNSQQYEIMMSSGRNSALLSPNQAPLLSPNQVPTLLSPNQAPTLLSPNQALSLHSPNQALSLHSPNQALSLHSPNQALSLHSPNQALSLHSPNQALSLHSPNQVQSHSQPVVSPSAVSLDSPNNLTVIEQGKCIPYREETKPFEMSDFYKYSTKFRQANVQKPNPAHIQGGYNKLPMELPQYAQEQWHGQQQ